MPCAPHDDRAPVTISRFPPADAADAMRARAGAVSGFSGSTTFAGAAATCIAGAAPVSAAGLAGFSATSTSATPTQRKTNVAVTKKRRRSRNMRKARSPVSTRSRRDIQVRRLLGKARQTAKQFRVCSRLRIPLQAARASLLMRSTIARSPLARCGVKCCARPRSANSGCASVAMISCGLRPEYSASTRATRPRTM